MLYIREEGKGVCFVRMREVVGEIRGERRVRQLCEKKGRGFRGEEMREKEERRNLTHLNIKQVS